MRARGHGAIWCPSNHSARSRAFPVGGSIWIVTPCKARRSFLEQTLSRMISDPDIQCCVVDYSCPELTADWIEEQFHEELANGQLCVERVVGESKFNKCRAHNVGARRAIEAGADYLCFLDADTLVHPGFHAWLKGSISPDSFSIAGLRDDGSDMPSMTGLLVTPADTFQRCGAFDEEFVGWGGEDIELRLRLFLLGGLAHREMPLSLATPLHHDNTLRSAFYDEGNIFESNAANMARIREKVEHGWQGRMVRPVTEAARLWYQRTPGARRHEPAEAGAGASSGLDASAGNRRLPARWTAVRSRRG
jgi:hypothetical protein